MQYSFSNFPFERKTDIRKVVRFFWLATLVSLAITCLYFFVDFSLHHKLVLSATALILPMVPVMLAVFAIGGENYKGEIRLDEKGLYYKGGFEKPAYFAWGDIASMEKTTIYRGRRVSEVVKIVRKGDKSDGEKTYVRDLFSLHPDGLLSFLGECVRRYGNGSRQTASATFGRKPGGEA